MTQPGSAFWSIMPYVEQENAYRARAYSAAVRTYICPARGRQQPQAAPANDPIYDGSHGWTDQFQPTGHVNLWCKTDYAINRGVSPTGLTAAPLNIPKIGDGTTNTLLVGEKAMDRVLYNTGTWWYDEPAMSGGTAGTSRAGTGVPLFPDQTLPPEAHTGSEFFTQGGGAFGSAHSSGVLFVLCDGSVRSIPFTTSAAVMALLLNPNDGMVVDVP
jgi:hypothetical protein